MNILNFKQQRQMLIKNYFSNSFIIKMDIIKYQYADPSEILKLDEDLFYDLIKQTIYKTNKKFSSSEACIARMLRMIEDLKIQKQSFLIVKNLMKFFQTPIVFFLDKFCKKASQCFIQMEKDFTMNAEEKEDKRKKYLKHFQQIGAIYKKLTDGVENASYFQCFTQFGVSEKEIKLQLWEADYQKKMFRFFTKCLQQSDRMKEKEISLKSKHQAIQKMQTEFDILKDSRDICILETIAFKRIIENAESFIESCSHPGTSLMKARSLMSPLAKQAMCLAEIYQQFKHVSPCCRKFFYQNEPINQAESLTLEYKNYKSPYDQYCVNNLKKAICAFLNRAGGIILVGIYENLDKYKEVRGQHLTQHKKQLVLKEFRVVCNSIYPDIISHGKFAVKFVPIKKPNGKYIPGKYVVRVQIGAGDQKSLYSYKQSKDEYVAFRTANQVLKREINQETLAKFKQKLLNPTKYPPIHDVPCPNPQIGSPTVHEKGSNRSLEKEYIVSQAYQKNERNHQLNRPKRQYWKQKNYTKTDSSQKQETTPDYVFFNSKRQTNQADPVRPRQEDPVRLQKEKNFAGIKQKESTNAKRSNNFMFACDEDEKQTLKKDQISKGPSEVAQIPDENQEDELDFLPVNPIKSVTIGNKNNFVQSKKWKEIYEQNYENKAPTTQIVKNYQQQKQIRPIKNLDYRQYLIIGVPFDDAKKILQQLQFDLVQDPIKCNHEEIVWIKVKSARNTNEKLQKLAKAIVKSVDESKKPKIRKLCKNLCFKEEPLLNKFIHTFRHDQQFTDEKGINYFSCKNNYESIQAYIIGWKMNYKIVFISDHDLKEKKLEYLRNKNVKKTAEASQVLYDR